MKLLKEEVQQMPTVGSSNPSMTLELELEVNLAVVTKGVTCQGLPPGTPHHNPPLFARAEPSQYYMIGQSS